MATNLYLPLRRRPSIRHFADHIPFGTWEPFIVGHFVTIVVLSLLRHDSVIATALTAPPSRLGTRDDIHTYSRPLHHCQQSLTLDRSEAYNHYRWKQNINANMGEKDDEKYEVLEKIGEFLHLS